MGYTGGTKANPTYYSLGNHTETLEIDYDPDAMSYQELLEIFWNKHSPQWPAFSQQYMSAIFYHDEEQKQAAENSKQQLQYEVHTKILPAQQFYLAEDYHQKYILRQTYRIVAEYLRIYPKLEDFVDSTAVTRVNAYLNNCGSAKVLQQEIGLLGLSEKSQEILLRACGVKTS